jgi:phosphoribosylanthranilate isomerase
MRTFSWPPRVQVAGVSSLEEALFCAQIGVNAVGFTLELPTGTHDDLTREKARTIIQRLPGNLLPVIVTYLQEAESARGLVTEVRAKAVQFHGGISEKEIRRFRDLCPGIMTIGRVTVTDQSAVETASQFRPPLWDAIILDSYDPETGRRGATGLTHDWTVSAEIVRATSIPAILAGGLNPDNVAEAIRLVRPAGGDAHTGLENADGTRSFHKIRAFAQAAVRAFAGLHPAKAK